MPPFASPIDVRPGTGDYAGRWEVFNRETGDRIADYATEAFARAALPGIRKYARIRRNALIAQDRPLFTAPNRAALASIETPR